MNKKSFIGILSLFVLTVFIVSVFTPPVSAVKTGTWGVTTAIDTDYSQPFSGSWANLRYNDGDYCTTTGSYRGDYYHVGVTFDLKITPVGSVQSTYFVKAYFDVRWLGSSDINYIMFNVWDYNAEEWVEKVFDVDVTSTTTSVTLTTAQYRLIGNKYYAKIYMTEQAYVPKIFSNVQVDQVNIYALYEYMFD